MINQPSEPGLIPNERTIPTVMTKYSTPGLSIGEEKISGLNLEQIKRQNYGLGNVAPMMDRPQIDYYIDAFKETSVLFSYTMKELDHIY